MRKGLYHIFFILCIFGVRGLFASEFFSNRVPDHLSPSIVLPEKKVKTELKSARSLKKRTLNSPQKQKIFKPIPKGKHFNKFREVLIAHDFPEESIEKMYCIAKNESGFNPLAYNYNKNGSFDVGIFQINQLWKPWCGMKDEHLLDLSNNTRCALIVLKKQGYKAWVAYRKFCVQ